MGFERTILSAMISAALVAPTAPVQAAGAKEPLIITKASDGGAILLASNAGTNTSLARAQVDETSSLDQAINSFASAVAAALRADQEATQAACKASKPPKPGTPASWTWGARCSYIRR
jgi:hypothetical protein